MNKRLRREDEKSLHILGDKLCVIQEEPRETGITMETIVFLQQFNETGRDPYFVTLILNRLSTKVVTDSKYIRNMRLESGTSSYTM